MRFIMLSLLALLTFASRPSMGDLHSDFMIMRSQLQRGPISIDPQFKKLIQTKQFILYPGAGGASTDVFTDNRRTLIEDFGVDPAHIIIRDVEKAYFGKDLNINEELKQESKFLRDQYKNSAARGFARPLVLISHSAHGRELFGAILLMANELRSGGIIDKAVFIESQLYEPSAQGWVDWAVSFVTKYFSKSQNAEILPANDPANPENVAKNNGDLVIVSKEKIFYVGYWASPKNAYLLVRGPGPASFGTYLGNLNEGRHIDTVVSTPRSKFAYEFRQAFTHLILNKIYGYPL